MEGSFGPDRICAFQYEGDLHSEPIFSIVLHMYFPTSLNIRKFQEAIYRIQVSVSFIGNTAAPICFLSTLYLTMQGLRKSNSSHQLSMHIWQKAIQQTDLSFSRDTNWSPLIFSICLP